MRLQQRHGSKHADGVHRAARARQREDVGSAAPPVAIAARDTRPRVADGRCCGRWPMLSPEAVSGDYACPA
eukprot:6253570-Prymnesium_polylepis.3